MAGSPPDEDLWVYHEKQVSSLCGQHCINNLVQAASFSAADLADIAAALDEEERRHMLAEGVDTPDALKFLAEESGNVDAAGNFSIQVLNNALKNLYGVFLVSAGSQSVGELRTTGYGVEEAFVLNRHSHWVAIRSIGGAYWDLNSMLDYPTRITTFALEAYVHQLQEEGYSVFVVRGNHLPPAATVPREGSRDSWYRVKDLLEVSKGGRGKGAGGTLSTAATDVWLNSGPGQRLDGRTTSAGGDGPGVGAALHGFGSLAGGAEGDDPSEAMQIAMAISASMGDSGGAARGGGSSGSGGREGGVGAGQGGDDEVARAIALSLSQSQEGSPEGGPGGVAGGAAAPSIYVPQPVTEREPKGPDVVRVQLRIGGSGKVVHGFRRSDPLTALLDVAAEALAKSDGKPLTAPFDVVAPGGRPLLKAGVIVSAPAAASASAARAGEEEGERNFPTIGSEQLSGASVIVRRA